LASHLRELRRAELIKQVWEYEYVDVHIGQIRSPLETDNQLTLIQTVRGVGYKFEAPKNSKGN